MVRDVQGAGAPAAAPGVAPTAASPRPATVLIIDDEPQIRRVVRTALEGEATVLLEAGTGAGGVALAGAEHPDLIILDLGLPNADGQTICRALRERSPAPIVVLTARHGEAEKISLFDAGADDYVTKPFSSDELRARVRAHLRRASGMVRPGRRRRNSGGRRAHRLLRPRGDEGWCRRASHAHRMGPPAGVDYQRRPHDDACTAVPSCLGQRVR